VRRRERKMASPGMRPLPWFAADSPLEQRRFELMVPSRTPAFRGRHMGPATAPGFGVGPLEKRQRSAELSAAAMSRPCGRY
jgi:hypothetical protein